MADVVLKRHCKLLSFFTIISVNVANDYRVQLQPQPPADSFLLQVLMKR